jgi:hypothetical protein
MSENRKLKSFNLQNTLFEVSLLPYEGEEVFINPEAVIQLVLEDNFFLFSKRGYIVFQNSYEMFERKLNKKNLVGVMGAKDLSQTNEEGYIFRNDGKDRIKLKIKTTKSKNSNAEDLNDTPDDPWLIEFTGNIYDFEDPSINEISSKVKKLYFWDEKFQKMVEKNLDWSSATSELNENIKSSEYDPKFATDEQKKVFTGDGIKDILKNKLKFEVDEENFDKGETKIFHTAPSNTNFWENILYLLNNHYSSTILKSGNNDLSFLIFDDVSEKFQLTPLSKIFEKAGNEVNTPKEYQIEHFLLEDIGNLEGTTNTNWMAPILKQYDPKIDVKIVKLKVYNFSDMSGVDSFKKLITTPAFNYNFKTKTFTRKVDKSLIKDIPSVLEKDYVEDVFLGKKASSHINLNKVKNENLSVNNVFTPISNLKILERISHGSLLLNSIFFNLCLNIQTEGATLRKSGKFVGVDRLTPNETEFDYKLGGQWFIVNVKHNFYKNSYVNEITCIKPHTYKKIDSTQEVE